MKEFQQRCKTIIENMEKVLVGKRSVVEDTLTCLLAGGHLLLEDVPGVGKTMLARSLAVSSGAQFKRIQCTPDLLPKDVTGISVYQPKNGEFEFRPGPIFADVVLVDEINRATPRTQSGMLECMAEGQVTIDGETRRLPEIFFVLATQNPVEFDGTFPLPEAQLDRFMMRLSVGYPEPAEEWQILTAMQEEHPILSLRPVVGPEEILAMRAEVRKVHVDPEVGRYLVELVTKTRNHPDFLLGASPRGSIDLFRSAQARALIQGRDYVIPEDVKGLAAAVLSHRLIVRSESRLRGRNAQAILTDLLQQVPVPVVQEG